PSCRPLFLALAPDTVFRGSLSEYSVEHRGMDNLHQLVVVPIVHRDTDDHGSLQCESLLQRRCDLIGLFDGEPSSTECLGESCYIDGAELDSRRSAILGHFLETNHVIGAVDPNQVHEVAFEPYRSLQFHGGEQEASISRNRNHLLAGSNKARSDSPRQPDAK